MGRKGIIILKRSETASLLNISDAKAELSDTALKLPSRQISIHAQHKKIKKKLS